MAEMAEEAAVLAVFITLAVDGEERPYSVRLSVPASWKGKDMDALLRAFVKRANKTDAFWTRKAGDPVELAEDA